MTTAAEGRIRRGERYRVYTEAENTGIRGVSARRARMTDSLNEDRFPNTQDWTVKAGMSPSGRFQIVEEPRKRIPLISAAGIRWDLARTALMIIGSVMIVVLLVMLAAIGSSSLQIRQLDEKISAVEQYNEELRGKISAESGDISVCTEAVRLNLISSSGARTIQLTAPRGANMMLSDRETTGQTSGEDHGMRAMAAAE